MPSSRLPSFESRPGFSRRLRPLLLTIGVLILLVVAALIAVVPEKRAEPGNPAEAINHPDGPPWRYGTVDARFTIVMFADLECPYCQTYSPVLRTWIDEHPDVNLQWHHLPLPMLVPVATQQARLAECVGETHGHAAFWQTVVWLYQHTRSDGRGLPPGTDYPGQDQAVQACLASERPDAIISAQANEARHAGVSATPTLHLIDHDSGLSLTLPGPAEGDALLSALDLLASGVANPDIADPHSEMPADVVSDMPR